MKTKVLFVSVGLIALALSGCAVVPQEPIQLKQDAFNSTAGKVGVVMTKLPVVNTYLPGANCLLCIAVAEGANSKLTAHTHTLSQEDLPDLSKLAADAVRKKGTDAVVIGDSLDLGLLPEAKTSGPGLPKKDFADLKNKYNVAKLLVIDISMLGMVRTYNSYVPTSDPQAVVRGAAYLVNLESNSYEWYLPIDMTKSADGAWDEPPQFPGLTNAYYQAIELSKDAVLKPLLN